MYTILMDIDGICFDPIERLNRCKNPDQSIDWDRAFSNAEVIQDPMLPNANAKVMLIIRLLTSKYQSIDIYYLYQSIDIYYLTGRSTQCREATLSALNTLNFMSAHYQTLLMRDLGDIRPDAIIKAEHIKRLTEDTIIAAVDDDYNGTLGPMYTEHKIPHYKSLDDYIKYLGEIL